MNKIYNTIIWDWNGTLIDDSWLAIEVMNDMLKSRQMELITIDLYRELFDFPVRDYYVKIGFDFSKEPFEIVGSEFIDLYDARHFELQLRPDAFNCISHFSAKSKNQYVLSARNHKQLAEEMNYFNILAHFKTFSGLSHNFAHGKVELGHQLIQNENILSEQALIIGDTTHDYEVARALGIDCILLENGHHSGQRLKRCGVPVLQNHAELMELNL